MSKTQAEQNSLPELDDGRPCSGQVGAGHVAADGGVSEAGVVAVLVTEDLQAVGCIPFVVTGRPREGGVEGLN